MTKYIYKLDYRADPLWLAMCHEFRTSGEYKPGEMLEYMRKKYQPDMDYTTSATSAVWITRLMFNSEKDYILFRLKVL